MGLLRGDAAGRARDALLAAAAAGREVLGTFRAPGGVNLIGEHNDYCGGPVLPTTLNLDLAAMALQPLRADRAHFRALDLGEEFTLPLEPSRWPHAADDPTSPRWARLVAALAIELARAGCPATPADVLVAGTVPAGAGLSSSSALAVVLAVAWRALAGRSWEPVELAELCLAAETRAFGVAGGLMDQICALGCGAGEAILIDCRDLTTAPVPLPPGLGVLVVDSAVRRTLATSAYNERRADCERALRSLRRRDPGLRHLAEATPDQVASAGLDPRARRRARHVVTEVRRVRDAVAALQIGDIAGVGALLLESHRSLANDFEVSTPELDSLVELAARIPGVSGARLTGAGFGGCAVVLVATGAEEDVAGSLRAAYRRATQLDATAWLVEPAPPAGPRPAPETAGR